MVSHIVGVTNLGEHPFLSPSGTTEVSQLTGEVEVVVEVAEVLAVVKVAEDVELLSFLQP